MFGFSKNKPTLEQVVNQEQKTKDKHLGTIVPQKNHILFEVNTLEKTILRAVFDTPESIMISSKTSNFSLDKKRKITINKNCIYISCMNKKSVLKRMKRDFNIQDTSLYTFI